MLRKPRKLNTLQHLTNGKVWFIPLKVAALKDLLSNMNRSSKVFVGTSSVYNDSGMRAVSRMNLISLVVVASVRLNSLFNNVSLSVSRSNSDYKTS